MRWIGWVAAVWVLGAGAEPEASAAPPSAGWFSTPITTKPADSAPGVVLADPSPPIVVAARDGDLDLVRSLLRGGADVNAAEGDGMTALHWAAHRNHPETAEILLFAGAGVEPRTRIGGYTPLLVGARVGSAEVMALLLEAGVDANVRTTTGGMSALHLAAEAGSVRAIEHLVAAGAELNARDAAWGHTPLMVAAANGRVEAARALIESGADVSLTNDAVDMAARQSEDQQLQRLRSRDVAFREELARDARAAIAGPEAAGPAESADGEAVTADAGAEETASGEPEAETAAEGEAEVEAEGVAGAEEAGDESDPEEGEDEAAEEDPDLAAHTPEVDPELAGPLVPEVDPELATQPGFAEPMDEAEPEEGAPREEFRPLSYADLVGGYGGFTALHLAARHGHRDLVMELLEAGAELNGPSEGDHTTPLLIATVNGHWDLAMELLELGADPNITSDAGVGPLYGVLNLQWAPRALHPQPRAHLAQQITHIEAMQRLLEAGADPNARLTRHLWYKSYNFDLLGVDSWGATPFWRAAYGTDLRAMRLLLEHGADPTVAARRPATRARGPAPGDEEEADPSGLPPVPPGDPSVTPLHAAAGVGYGEGFAANAHQHVPGGWLPSVRFLVEEVGLDVNARDHNGFTPLHHAAARGDLDLIRYLVEQGADVTAVSRSGLTTADMANGPAQRVPPYPQAIALLRQLGSDFNNRCLSC